MAYQISMLKWLLCLDKARILWLCLIMFGAIIGFSEPSYAQEDTSVTCSDDGSLFDPAFGNEAFDMIKGIIYEVDSTLASASEDLYRGIIGSSDYQASMVAAVTGFIIIYGVAILFGLVPVTLAQAAIRLLKFAFVFLLISEDGWDVTSDFVGGIFNEGTLEIINSIIALSGQVAITGVDSGCGPLPAIDLTDVGAPVEIFRCALSEVMNPRIFVILFATFTTGPYGPIMGLALGWALYSLFMMLIRAFQVYVLSMIVRALLIGMSPLFFGFMWFEKTKPIFMGWVNQLINFSLQPIMLFAFLAFFLQLVTGALTQMVPGDRVEVCFVKATAISAGQQVYGWKFTVDGDVFQGSWTSRGPTIGEIDGGSTATLGAVFPITPISILVFLILTYIASEMATVVTQMASEMSQGFVKLDEGSGSDPIRNLARTK